MSDLIKPVLSRRQFLIAGTAVGGGLLVGCASPTPANRLGSPTDFPAAQGEVALNGWVKIGPDGRITVAVPRSEMGQGVMTSLPMLLVEELDARWEDVSVEQAPVARIYANTALLLNVIPFGVDDDSWVARVARSTVQRLGYALSLQVTGGSSSIRDAWEPLRLAGATARAMLIQAAAKQWQVKPQTCDADNGRVIHTATGRSLRYAELAEAAAKLAVPDDVPFKDPARYKLIGKPVRRLDIPAKTNGQAQFGIDVKVDGMAYAALAQPPVFGSQVKSFDDSAARSMRGVLKVVQIRDGVAVVANSWWRAKQALAQVKIEYTRTEHDQLSSADIRKQFERELQERSGFGFVSKGNASRTIEAAPKRLEATYWAPYLAHAAMEPINCVARVKDKKVEVWVSTQSPSLAKWKAAQIAGVDMDDVTLHVPLLGGGFGRRLEIDMVEQAVEIAKALDGQAVKLVWTREDDTQHDMYRPAALSRFEAALDKEGRVTAWSNKLVAQSIGYDSVKRLLPWAAADTPDKNQIEGAFDIPYDFEHISVRQVRPQTPVPVGSWRSVGHSYNAFFTESFVDELAHAVGQDPYQYRRQLIAQHPRHRIVLDLAAQKAGWDQPLPKGMARGIALHESFGSICAQVAEVSIDNGQVKVHRVVCAIDCGIVVNPDTVEAQMQSSIVFGLSAALFGEITLSQGRVEQSSFPSYDMVRLAQMPKIETHIVRNTHAPGGVGEPGTPPIAPAVANALYVLTRQRIRSLPIRLG
ncbi:xanthine dehydrogenase family protein molybdopterin-binding subunit [Aquabacterium sp.]|uniref:xanthine dehydrogenase family protein molybdopterin-binding subunit n=1 Tax=Aquabacterium sp. TaxID=1872578 RepID=UPI002E310BF9|nr:xanthine dehydrogenase family protein molybdopterin-binding subunit [Aquabacterium sp.]HEX5312434.1 xanthine dehydrogenase family protein molybdopterin-binding subunit [Aquabacterium sp.]